MQKNYYEKMEKDLGKLVEAHGKCIENNDFGGALNVSKNIECVDRFLRGCPVEKAFNGAIKNGLRIGVVSQYQISAEAFIAKEFNQPHRIKKSKDELKYEYLNGDTVRWIQPIDGSKGMKFDLLFIQEGIDKKILDYVIIPLQKRNPIQYFE